MKKRITLFIAPLLLVALIVPAVFFLAPPRTHADNNLCLVGVAAGIAAAVANLILTVPSGDLGAAGGSWTGAGGSVGDCIYNSIIVPMLRGLIRSFLQQMTQDTINWINGTGASGGQKSFVPNLSVHLQAVGDSAAMAFLGQIVGGFQSPFDMSIAASLRTQYLQQTSVAGFFSQFRSTLSQASPNINSFLAGNWSQGGVSAWLALTTQRQNNPYVLYQAAASQLASNVADAQTNRRQDLLQSGGFLSFCPANPNSGGSAANPQAQCTDSSGKPVDATTPGSVIMSFLETNVNSGIGQLVSAQDLDSALFAVVQALTSKVLNSTGLFGGSSGGNRSVGGTGPTSGGSTGGASLAQTVITNIGTYTTAWNAVQSAALAAQTSVNTLSNSCSAELSLGMIGTTAITSSDVASALTGEIGSVSQQAQTALASASTTAAFAQQVISESNSPSADPAQVSTDVQTLLSMPPTSSDLAIAEMNAQVTGQARANPTGSLAVSGGSMVDQMNLISTNANNLAPQCAGYHSTGTGTGTTGVINGGTLINANGLQINQSWKYVTPAANQTACFNFNVDSANVGNVFTLNDVVSPGQDGGGTITYWISSTLGGGDIGNTLTSQLYGSDTTLVYYGNPIHYSPTTASTYYFCLKPGTNTAKVGAWLLYNSISGGA